MRHEVNIDGTVFELKDTIIVHEDGSEEVSFSIEAQNQNMECLFVGNAKALLQLIKLTDLIKSEMVSLPQEPETSVIRKELFREVMRETANRLNSIADNL